MGEEAGAGVGTSAMQPARNARGWSRDVSSYSPLDFYLVLLPLSGPFCWFGTIDRADGQNGGTAEVLMISDDGEGKYLYNE